MLKQIQKTVLVFSALFASFASASAADLSATKPFSYRAEIPAASATCDQEAAALGQRFAQSTGLTVSSTLCQSTQTIEKLPVFTLVVNYLAAQEVVPYSAIYTDEGIFNSYTDCLAALPAQQAAFVTNTGLSVLASGCSAVSIGDGYSPYIDAIGTPSHHFYTVCPTFDAGLSSDPGIYDVYKAQLIAAGAVIVYTGQYDIFYYASSPIKVSVNWVTSYLTDTTECQTEAGTLQQIYASLGVSAVVSCLPSDFSSLSDLVVTWIGESFPVAGDHAMRSLVYNSFDECEQDKPRVVQNSTSAGGSPLGAICERNEDGQGFVVEVFSKAPYTAL